MNTLPAILFDSDWSQRRSADGATFQHPFTLEPTDYCVNYHLHIAGLPPGATIRVNGQPVGAMAAGSFAADVTIYVALGDNRIEIALPESSGNVARALGSVRLQPVLCE